MAENKFKRPIMAPGFLNPDGSAYDPGSGGANVTSVNGETGDVVLTAIDVGALPDTYTAPQAAAQADSAATDVPGLVTDFNDLLAKLRAAGLMAE